MQASAHPSCDLGQDAVAVIGYPIGGDTISVTSGVVSRIEVTAYVHGSTELLAVQIDAAINSGNSGTPHGLLVLAAGLVAGQDLCWPFEGLKLVCNPGGTLFDTSHAVVPTAPKL